MGLGEEALPAEDWDTESEYEDSDEDEEYDPLWQHVLMNVIEKVGSTLWADVVRGFYEKLDWCGGT